MKPFNLEEALAGKLCVTRDGKQAIIMFDRSTVFPNNRFVLGGYLRIEPSDKHWCDELVLWTRDGCFNPGGAKDSFDIVGMWEEPQPEVTVTFPAPLKEAENGQEVWYLNYDPYTIYGHAINVTKPKNEVFNNSNGFLQHLLETGQLFATKDDAEKVLEAMKGARR